MIPFIKHLAGFFFYALGLSFFLAYVFLRNDILTPWPLWWMQVGDTPLILSGLVYGGLSLQMSLHSKATPPKHVWTSIIIMISILFILALVLNFWPV